MLGWMARLLRPPGPRVSVTFSGHALEQLRSITAAAECANCGETVHRALAIYAHLVTVIREGGTVRVMEQGKAPYHLTLGKSDFVGDPS